MIPPPPPPTSFGHEKPTQRFSRTFLFHSATNAKSPRFAPSGRFSSRNARTSSRNASSSGLNLKSISQSSRGARRARSGSRSRRTPAAPTSSASGRAGCRTPRCSRPRRGAARRRCRCARTRRSRRPWRATPSAAARPGSRRAPTPRSRAATWSDSTSTYISASGCFTPWYLPIGAPNWMRSLAYCTVSVERGLGGADASRPVTAIAPRSKRRSIAGHALARLRRAARSSARARSRARACPCAWSVDRRERSSRVTPGAPRVDDAERQVLAPGRCGTRPRTGSRRPRRRRSSSRPSARTRRRRACRAARCRSARARRSPRASASVPIRLPSARPGSQRAFCSSLPESRIAAAASVVDTSGDGNSERPVSSSSTTRSTQPSPAPPCASGIVRPSQPSSARLPPQLGASSRGSRLHQRAHLLERAARVQELAHLGAQQLLLFRESEVHAVHPGISGGSADETRVLSHDFRDRSATDRAVGCRAAVGRGEYPTGPESPGISISWSCGDDTLNILWFSSLTARRSGSRKGLRDSRILTRQPGGLRAAEGKRVERSGGGSSFGGSEVRASPWARNFHRFRGSMGV